MEVARGPVRRDYALLLGASLLMAAVPTLWPELDWAVARYFFGPDAQLRAADWAWVSVLNRVVPDVSRWAMVLAFVLATGVATYGWLSHRRLRGYHRALYVGAGLLIGPGLAVLGVKHTWLRARPVDVQAFGGPWDYTPALAFAEQCSNNCAFVSGHVACGFFVSTLLLWGGPRRWAWALLGSVCGLLIGFARVAEGAHWLSDVLWAYPVTLLACWPIWAVVRRLPGLQGA